jgi:hypothetical protein
MSALSPKAAAAAGEGRVRYGPKADSCGAAKRVIYSITSSARANAAGNRDAQRFGGFPDR